jgi:hypothetical protein
MRGDTIAAATFLAFKVREPVRSRPQPPSGTVCCGRSAGSRTVLRDRVFLAFVGVEPVDRTDLHAAPVDLADGDESGRPAGLDFGTVIALNGVLIVAASCSSPVAQAAAAHHRAGRGAVVLGIGSASPRSRTRPRSTR